MWSLPTLAAMTTVATLTPPELRLAPGSESRCTVTIRNRGEIVEGYHLEVLGEAAGWATVTPPQVQVYPGTEATAEIVFRIPRGARVYATDVPFAVRVLPMERPDQVVVPEGLVRIGELAELAGELLPQTSRTRRATVHDVAIDNLGNAPVVVDLTVTDPDNALKLEPRPARMTIGPGRAALARVSVRHRRFLWRGTPVARRFQITAATADGPGVALDGTSVQEPIIGKWLVPAAAALLALALLGAGLWFGLLKQAVKSEAGKAGKEAGTAAAEEVANKQPNTTGNVTPSESPTPPPPNPDPNDKGAATPVNLQGSITDAPGGNFAQATLRNPSPNEFAISYVMINAPQADSALLQIFIGNNAWQVHNLANIRDYDVHPSPAIRVPANSIIRLRLTCNVVGPDKVSSANTCFANVVISGTEYKATP
jgi:hypothetical protein